MKRAMPSASLTYDYKCCGLIISTTVALLNLGVSMGYTILFRARFESVRALRSHLHIPTLSYFCRRRVHELCCNFASVHAELILSSHLH
jgi:hypothetical protein